MGLFSFRRNPVSALSAFPVKIFLLCFCLTAAVAGCSKGGPPPEAPLLMGVESKNEAVIVTWNPVEGATGYEIKYGTDSEKYDKTINTGNTTTCTVSSLKNDTEYYFAVAAVSKSGRSKLSNELSAVPYPVAEVQPGGNNALDDRKIKHGTIWVSNTGDDFNNDGSKRKPLRTIGYALCRAQPGDTIMVKKGIYYEYEIGRSAGGDDNSGGTEEKKITLKSETLHGAIIDGLEAGEVIRLANKQNLVFDGFEIRNSSSNLIHADGGCRNLIFRNIKAHHAGSDGDVMKFNQSVNITVENCDVSYPGNRTQADSEAQFQELVDFVDVDNAIIRNSKFHHAGNMAIYAKGGSRNALFENNILIGNNLIDNPGDGLLGIGAWTSSDLFVNGDEYESYNMTVRNNIIINAKGQAISIYDSFGAKICNNVIINSGSHGIFFRKGNAPADETRDVEIFNNIFIDTKGGMITPIAKQPERSVHEVKSGSNIFWNNGSPIPQEPYNGSPAVIDVLKKEYESIVKDPKLKNLKFDFDKLNDMSIRDIAEMFTPKSGSPAIGNGTPLKYSPANFFGKKWTKSTNIGAI